MTEYKHGAYGQIIDSAVESMINVSTVPVYFGTAPVNLIRGYALSHCINEPVKISSLADARAKIGDSSDWTSFTLCEATAAHFNTLNESVGPIYIINVLDPDKHKASKATDTTIGMVKGVASFASDKVILDTLRVAKGEDGNYEEGTDYSLSYNFNSGKVVITAIEGGSMVDGNISVSYFEVTPASITKDDIIGTTTDAGVYSGVEALALLYQEQFVVPNLLAAPGWTHIPEIYDHLCKSAQKVNGHWDAFVYADLPIEKEGKALDTISGAAEWKRDNGYTSERSSVFWPQVQDASGRVFHLSTLAVVESLRADNENNGVPFDGYSNKSVPVCRQYFGSKSNSRGFDQQAANTLNESGISSCIGWAGDWILWGPHTAAYSFGSSTMDARQIFVVSMRMLFHITNYFQLEWAHVIDKPMTRAVQDRIVNKEQAKLDAYIAQGALIGHPTIVFDESENPQSELMEGNFRWDIDVTPTPPLKSASVFVAYTDAGFNAYFEEDE